MLPAEGGEAWNTAGGAGPAGGRPWGGQWGPPGGHQQPLPPQQPGPYDQQPGPYGAHPGAYQQHQPQPPQHQQPPQYAQPLPPEAPAGGADADATQYLPPVAAAGGAPQPQPRPQAQPLPAPAPGESPAESTQFLGTGPAAAHAQDADATQYISPVPPQPSGAPFGIRPGAPGDRQPPAEFDSLFRSDAPATQALPPVTDQAPHQQARQPYQPPQQYQDPQPYQEPAPRRSSKLPLIAAVVVGCAVLGLGAGALLSGGEGEKKGAPDKAGVAGASSPTPGSGASQAAPDPARTQAEALDKLLADSNNSRDTVIRSVENIKKCQGLDQAATDLRGAAGQRRNLVTRLQALSVDKLPSHTELSAALTRAWQASAAADDHYAAWAGEVKGKKGCKGGKARSTGQFAQGNRASGDATTAKQEASRLWNAIAGTYGLTPRQPAQL
ncbi:hypothetical protein EIZ62_18610 [Streptomyces ficellus]|uniref:Uncharacterized protein n=1 Tax=Streptomyces ficellus TaxID=1977088 RepID=A0A6I6FQE6_9ACTN|nr:hypothetical protein EIZ62_18610 [Streptomyces ficellus]